MVDLIFIRKIVKRLETYLLRKNDFVLSGKTYDLILFIPSEKYTIDSKYSVIVSSKVLNQFHQKDLIKEILLDFKDNLNLHEYNAISRLSVINSDEPLVKNLQLMFRFREEIYEINQIPVGGVNIDFAYLVKSMVLDKLIVGNAVTLDIQDGDEFQRKNAGILRMENNFDLVFYTGKALREIFGTDGDINLKNSPENDLIVNEFISKVNLNSILKIY